MQVTLATVQGDVQMRGVSHLHLEIDPIVSLMLIQLWCDDGQFQRWRDHCEGQTDQVAGISMSTKVCTQHMSSIIQGFEVDRGHRDQDGAYDCTIQSPVPRGHVASVVHDEHTARGHVAAILGHQEAEIDRWYRSANDHAGSIDLIARALSLKTDHGISPRQLLEVTGSTFGKICGHLTAIDSQSQARDVAAPPSHRSEVGKLGHDTFTWVGDLKLKGRKDALNGHTGRVDKTQTSSTDQTDQVLPVVQPMQSHSVVARCDARVIRPVHKPCSLHFDGLVVDVHEGGVDR